MSNETDLLVIGGGAAGMAAAVTAAEHGDRVLILERGNRNGRKIAASGNGRCNLLNRGQPRYYGDSRFAEKVISLKGAKEQTGFWKRYGLELVEETEGRVYPMTLNSSSVNLALETAMKMNGVAVRTGTEASKIKQTVAGFCVTARCCGDDLLFTADRVLVAAGGPAGTKHGGTDAGYRLLAGMGHTIIAPKPALTSCETDPRSVSGLAGIRTRARIAVLKNGKPAASETGEILFTETGLSGICVMQCARAMETGDQIELDLTLGFGGYDKLTETAAYRKERFGELTADWLLNGILMPKLSFAVCKQAGLPMRGEKLRELDSNAVERTAWTAAHYRMEIKSIRGFEHAQVTAGGADCSQFRPETMESTLTPGLYAAGEVLNVDGDCGGFNLMFAFGSGMLAGENGRKPL